MKNPTLRICVILFTFLLIIAVSIILVGCSSNPNKQVLHRFQYARIYIPDGTSVGGRITDYRTYSNGACVVVIDGVQYGTHISNVVLTMEANEIYSSHSEESE